MKIGILTFHSQLNYGGVLQAVASYTYLKKQGYDAVVVDRWLSRGNPALRGIFVVRSPKVMLKEWIKFLLQLGIIDGGIRHWGRIFRTCRLLSTEIVRTKRHFCAWEELAGEPLEFDALVVGSDQVWSTICGKLDVYLLEGLKQKTPAISYAASLGITSIPAECARLYRRGLARFSAISVRENTGKDLIEKLGVEMPVTHVVDPVLLLERADWEQIADAMPQEGDTIFCYILREHLADALPKIIAWSNKHKVKVSVYPDGPYAPFAFRHPIRSFIRSWKLNSMLLFSRVGVKLSGGPKEFVRDLARAKGVITDSFHATMFSAIFDKNVRVLRPNNDFAVQMFSRMEEFAANYTSGDMFADSLDDAFQKMLETPRTLRYDYARLREWQDASRAWLKQAVGILQEKLIPRRGGGGGETAEAAASRRLQGYRF